MLETAKRGQVLMFNITMIGAWLVTDPIGPSGRKKAANPNVCGALIKLVSICQAENSQKPKADSAFLTTDVTDITDARGSGNYPRYPRNLWWKRLAGLATKRRRRHKKETAF